MAAAAAATYHVPPTSAYSNNNLTQVHARHYHPHQSVTIQTKPAPTYATTKQVYGSTFTVGPSFHHRGPFHGTSLAALANLPRAYRKRSINEGGVSSPTLVSAVTGRSYVFSKSLVDGAQSKPEVSLMLASLLPSSHPNASSVPMRPTTVVIKVMHIYLIIIMFFPSYIHTLTFHTPCPPSSPLSSLVCCTHKNTNAQAISLAFIIHKSGPTRPMLRELQALCCLSVSSEHPNVTPLIEAMVDEEYLYLIMPYGEGGDLFNVIDAYPNGLDEREAALYFRQIVDGLLHLKRHGLAHG